MNLSTVASTCSEITVILAALAMLIKPIRNKLLGLDKLTDALKCQLRQAALVDENVCHLRFQLRRHPVELRLSEDNSLCKQHSHHFFTSFL